MFSYLLNILETPFRIRELWKRQDIVSKAHAVGIGAIVVAKTAGVLALWYNPWVILPAITYTAPIIVKGIQFVFI